VHAKVLIHLLSLLFYVTISRWHKWGDTPHILGCESLGSLLAGLLALRLSVFVSLYFCLCLSPFPFPHPSFRFLAVEENRLQENTCKNSHDGIEALCQQPLRKWGPPNSYMNGFGSGFPVQPWDKAALTGKLDVTWWKILAQKTTVKFIPGSWPCEIMLDNQYVLFLASILWDKCYAAIHS
jgi:hypothetical protein